MPPSSHVKDRLRFAEICFFSSFIPCRAASWSRCRQTSPTAQDLVKAECRNLVRQSMFSRWACPPQADLFGCTASFFHSSRAFWSPPWERDAAHLCRAATDTNKSLQRSCPQHSIIEIRFPTGSCRLDKSIRLIAQFCFNFLAEVAKSL